MKAFAILFLLFLTSSCNSCQVIDRWHGIEPGANCTFDGNAGTCIGRSGAIYRCIRYRSGNTREGGWIDDINCAMTSPPTPTEVP